MWAHLKFNRRADLRDVEIVMDRLTNIFSRYRSNTLAIDENGQTANYGDICEFSERIKSLDPQKKLVFCLSDNSLGSLVGYLSFLSAGWVPLMLDKNIDRKLLDDLISQYSPNYIWAAKNCIDTLTANSLNQEIFSYQLYRTESSKCISLNEQIALLLTTSGSTGSPKLVRISYSNILENAASIAKYLDINSQERPITTLPMYYSYGLSVIHSHILCGATILLTSRSIMEKEFWSMLKEEQASSIAGVPYTFEMLHRLRFERMNLPHLKTITQAGGKLNPKLVEYFANACNISGKRFFVMYGQTEATARMSYLPSELVSLKPSSIGIAIPGGDFHLTDENGNEITLPNIAGELLYKGANVSMGYAESILDLEKGDENKGLLYTGDIAHRDEDGLYYIVGRKKRFIKIFGNRVSLDAAEQLLKEITGEVACIGVDDKLTIFITDPSKSEEVKRFISTKTGIHISAFDIQVIKEIPKSSSGKVLYSQLHF